MGLEGIGSLLSVRGFLAVVSGALLGLLLSFLVNCTLVEISLNAFFRFYFGCLFVLVGGGILVRVCAQRQEPLRRLLLVTFALMVLASGVLCFFFEDRWIFELSTAAKIPLYGLLGISACFAVTFSIVDVLNFCLGLCNPEQAALIESDKQVTLVVVASVVMGLGYGIFFGVLQVGKTARTTEQLSKQLIHEEMFCVPFGIAIGAISAAANEYFRNRQIQQQQYKYSPLFQDENDLI